MASTDALIAPVKAVAFRMPMGPFFKTDGTIITGWTSADSEISEDGANYTDCTNEATEIQTSGTGFLDLTSGETNCDAFWIKTTISNTDAVPFVAYFSTQRAGAYLRSDVREFLATAYTDGAIPAAVAGASGGLVIAGSNAATTFATLTSTGAFTVDDFLIGGNFDVVGATSLDSLAVNNGVTLNSITVAGGFIATNAGNDIRGVTISAIANNAITAASIANGAIDAATFVSGALDAVWSTATRTLTDLPAIPANWITAAGIANDAIVEIAEGVDAELSANHGGGAWGASGGSGAFTITITVTDGTDPIQNASYGIYDSGVLAASGLTDASGNGVASLDSGSYLVALVKGGYIFTPVTRTVVSNETGTLTNDLEMTAVIPPSPSPNPSKGTIYGSFINSTGANAPGVIVTATLRGTGGPYRIGDNMVVPTTVQARSIANGTWTMDLFGNADITPSGSFWQVAALDTGFNENVTVVSGEVQNMKEYIV